MRIVSLLKQMAVYCVICVGILMVLALSFAVVALYSDYQYSWTIDEINELIAAEIPSEASNIVIQGRHGFGARLLLRFDASPASIARFQEKLCDGIFYPGYDPFNAIDVGIGEPPADAHLIQLGLYPYFSYSLDTPTTILGNRCGNETGGALQVRIDKTNPQSHSVDLEVTFSCEFCSPADGYITPTPQSHV